MKKISIVLVVFAVIIQFLQHRISRLQFIDTESSTSDSSSTKNIIWGEIATVPEVYAAPDVTQQQYRYNCFEVYAAPDVTQQTT